jgi:hypothetical protein
MTVSVQPLQERYNSHGHAFVLLSLDAIEHMCTQEKSNAETLEKYFHKNNKGDKRPGTKVTIQVPKKVCHKKHCNVCQKHGGSYTMHNTKDCCRYEKNGMEKYFRAAKKGIKKSNSTKQSFTQLSEKMEKLKKAIKKKDTKRKKHCHSDSNSNLE